MADLTAKDIQQLLAMHPNSRFHFRQQYAVLPNVAWALLPWEADLLLVSKAGYLTEIEIKISFQDWKKDIEKQKWRAMSDEAGPWHRAHSLIKRFYYASPEKLAARHEEIRFPAHAGVLAITEKRPADPEDTRMWWWRYGIKEIKKPGLNQKARDLTHDELWKIGRLAAIKLWTGDPDVATAAKEKNSYAQKP